jgi:hypothetical protein
MSSKRAKNKFGGWGVMPLKNSLNPRKHYASINRFPHRIVEEGHVND